MKTEFVIHRLECTSCVVMIESLTEDHPGVTGAEVRAKQKILVVEHQPGADLAKLVTTLSDAGYTVEVKPAA